MFLSKVLVIASVIFSAVYAAPRSSGSNVALLKQFPYQVVLFTQTGWCGGVLISHDWVLTSAQCIEGTKTLTAVLGAHDIAGDEESQVRLEISMGSVFLHEDWDENALVNDIAAVGLPEAVQFTDYIKPAVLPQVSYAELTLDGLDATASGWSYELSSELRYGSVSIGKQSDCAGFFEGGEVDASIVCLRSAEDTCRGDLGSPLVLKDASSTLIGLASFGWSSGCVLGENAMFTRITSHVRWIYETTGVINNRF